MLFYFKRDFIHSYQKKIVKKSLFFAAYFNYMSMANLIFPSEKNELHSCLIFQVEIIEPYLSLIKAFILYYFLNHLMNLKLTLKSRKCI